MEAHGRRREDVRLPVFDLLDHARMHFHELGELLLSVAPFLAQPAHVLPELREQILMRAVTSVRHTASCRLFKLTYT